MAGTHKCPVRVCSEQVSDAKLVCDVHWRMLPVEHRRAVWAGTLPRRRGGGGANMTACMKAVDWLDAETARLRVEGEQLNLGEV